MGQLLIFFKKWDLAYKKAYVSALNKGAKSALVKVLRDLRENYNIKAKDLKQYARIKRRATIRNPSVTIAYSQSIPLDRFPHKQDKKGIKAKVRQQKIYKGTFFMKMKGSGKTSIFKRKGKERLPVFRKTGLNLGLLLTTDKELSKLEKIFYEKYEKVYQHELDWYLGKIKI